MDHFERIRQTLRYIDGHLAETLEIDALAARVHLSPYYFHRLFTLVVGKTVAAYVRDRRILHACRMLAETDATVLAIALECGFQSASSFSRTFAHTTGMPPTAYRQQGLLPDAEPVDALIVRLTNRLQGGMSVHPRIIKRPALCIAGVTGDGFKTGEAWQAVEALSKERPLAGQLGEHGYEVRIQRGEQSIVHVGYAVAAGEALPEGYARVALPAATYAAFDVYVARGYMSENDAMEQWLRGNEQGYTQRLLDGDFYMIEFYDERFTGDGEGSIVEMWIPVEKKA